MDRLTVEQRSRNMAAIKGKDTKPEVAVRRLLHNLGFRFRLHRKDLPGKPDIVLPKYKTIVLVHGCFWHRHVGCNLTSTPKSKVEFWRTKLEKNVERDKRTVATLTDRGWRVLIVWQCEVSDLHTLRERLVKEITVLP